MNIFYVDSDPKKAAESLCDKHVVKMILETAQLLCTAISISNNVETPYKATHKNHPCAIWARESLANFFWLYTHGIALCKEYTARYNKIHKSESIIEWCGSQIQALKAKSSSFTTPPLCMPDQYKTSNPVESYRKYYILDKMQNIKCEWKRNKPSWI